MKEMLKKYLLEFKNGTKTMFKEFFKKDTNKKQRANMWTFIRLIIPILTLISSILATITASVPLFIATGAVAGFGAVTDYFDGKSARKHGSYSEYGKILDQASDKFFAGIIGINLLFLNFNYIFVLLGEALIASINISYKLKYKDLNISSTQIGKIKEWPLFITLALGYLSTISSTFLLISNISIAITTLFQLATTQSYLKSNSEGVKELKKNENSNLVDTLNSEEEKNVLIIANSIEKTHTDKKNISRTEQCEELRKLKNELTIDTDGVALSQEDSYQKIKK